MVLPHLDCFTYKNMKLIIRQSVLFFTKGNIFYLKNNGLLEGAEISGSKLRGSLNITTWQWNSGEIRQRKIRQRSHEPSNNLVFVQMLNFDVSKQFDGTRSSGEIRQRKIRQTSHEQSNYPHFRSNLRFLGFQAFQ